MLLISIIVHPAIIMKIFRPFFIAIQYLYALKFSIWFPPQLPICISVCFKNGQLRLELPTHCTNYAIFSCLHLILHQMM